MYYCCCLEGNFPEPDTPELSSHASTGQRMSRIQGSTLYRVLLCGIKSRNPCCRTQAHAMPELTPVCYMPHNTELHL